MKKIISLVATVLMLTSFCLIPSMAMAEGSVVITTQPKPVMAAEGETVTFFVIAQNAETYQWFSRKSSADEWTAIEKDGDSAEYKLTAKLSLSGYQFRCIAMNATEQAISDEVTLTVIPKIAVGTSALPSVEAPNGTSGQDILQTIISSADPVSVPATPAVPTFEVPSETSGQDILQTIVSNADPVIVSKPVDAAPAAEIPSNASGQDILQTIISNANPVVVSNPVDAAPAAPASPSLEIPSDASGQDILQAIINSTGPAVVSQPADVEVKEGEKAVFSIVANNASTYQWYYRTSAQAAWTAVKANGTSATYTIKAQAKYNGYQFRCIVMNQLGQAISNPATLTVIAENEAVEAIADVQDDNGNEDALIQGKSGLPIITTQPESKKVSLGTSAAFKVEATGATSYRWYLKKPNTTTWTETSKTAATYSVTTGTAHNGMQYKCKVSNSAGSVWTNVVTLTVVPEPVISTQPVSKTVNVGDKVVFKVVASGAKTYNWYTKKPNATSWTKTSKTAASYSLTAGTAHNGMQYKCQVTNDAGSVWSDVAVLTVGKLPTITTQPESKKVSLGTSAAFKVAATDATGYRWYLKKPNATTWTETSKTTATYSVTTGTAHNGMQYKCKVSNDTGFVWSDVATLTVVPEPVIITQPVSKTVNVGGKIVFKVVASGAKTYVWYTKKPTATTWSKTSKTTATYSVVAGTAHHGMQYKCLVSNDAGSVWSDVVVAKVLPSITTQPESKSVSIGARFTLSVVSKNATSYQWYSKKPNATEWSKMSKTTASFSLTAGTAHNGMQYKCQVTNDAGSVWSEVATLTVMSNRCGENLTWSLDNNGVLTISGSGDMWDYETIVQNNADLAWRDSVKELKVTEGVTSIGDGAFESCTKMTKASLASTVTRIGKRAFKNCTSLSTMTSP